MTRRSSRARVVEDLTARIRRGEFPHGAKLPSYRQLAESYEVSMATAQRAVRLLRTSGALTGMKGRGVYVNKLWPRQAGGCRYGR